MAARFVERGTGNREQGTGNGERERGTGNREQGTGNGNVELVNRLRYGADIAERLLALGASIVAPSRGLPRDVAGKHVASLVRSETSAGASYEEGRAAESRADFAHKLRIAAEEVRETLFWLRLVHRSALLPSNATQRLDALIREANELSAILMSSARTARRSTT